MNDNAPLQRPEGASIDEAARQWFTHLRGDVSPATRADFAAWLSAGPDNDAAYQRVAQDFAQAEILKGSSLYGTGRPQRGAGLPHHKGWIAGILAIAATLVIAVLRHGADQAPFPPNALAKNAMALTTRHGEIRTEHLSDGTRVTLDTDSRIDVAITGHERRIRLTRGHIRLSIAKDSRPFRVDAGAGAITAPMASEASFDIGYDDAERVRVAMISGHAEARPLLQTAHWAVPAATLDAGQNLGWSTQGFSSFPEAAGTSHVDAAQWPTGWVSYQTVPLEELVAQANQYADRPIILDGTDVGRIAVSGRFHISEPGSLAGNLADVLGLDLISTPGALHLRQK